jgi:hypothetical protein
MLSERSQAQTFVVLEQRQRGSKCLVVRGLFFDVKEMFGTGEQRQL